jgi:hypothetical protein
MAERITQSMKFEQRAKGLKRSVANVAVNKRPSKSRFLNLESVLWNCKT